MRRKKILSILLVGALTFGGALQVHASSINDARQKANELQEKKKAAEAEEASLSKQLSTVIGEMEKTQADITKKQDEILKKEEELMQATLEENNQYESMKKRIKYMYENGNVQFFEILIESKSIGDFLNKAEYISQISEYDRNMLVEFQKVVKNVEDQEAALQEENEKLQQLQNDLVEKQANVQTLLAGKSAEISSLESEIGENATKISELEAAAAAAAQRQSEANSGYVSNGGGASNVSGNGMLSNPCPSAYISSRFGGRNSPTAGASSNHKGTDFAAGTGSPIYAADGGYVTTAAYSSVRGNYIVINHGNGLSTLYQHCSQIYVQAGQTVERGQNIAAVGTTGVSTGPHLHFEVWVNGTPVDPELYL